MLSLLGGSGQRMGPEGVVVKRFASGGHGARLLT